MKGGMGMEIVIKIHEKDYQSMKNGHIPYSVLSAIMNGIPLPKGHGRLIDADDIALIDEQFYIPSDYYVAESAINDTPTIIEAYKAESEVE